MIADDVRISASERVAAATALSRLNARVAAVPALLAVAESPLLDAAVRITAAKELREPHPERMAAVLRSIVNDAVNNMIDRTTAALALGEVAGPAEAKSTLLALADASAGEPVDSVRIAKALAELGLIEEALRRCRPLALDKSAEPTTRYWAAAVLARHGDRTTAVSVLRDLATGAEMPSAAWANLLLLDLGHAADAKRELVRLANEEGSTPFQRLIAADGLVERGLTELARPALLAPSPIARVTRSPPARPPRSWP